jgi:hypothetical protein
MLIAAFSLVAVLAVDFYSIASLAQPGHAVLEN